MLKKNKVQIIIGLVIWFITTCFLSPLIKFVWQRILSTSPKLYSSYVDSLYKSASAGDMSAYNVFILFQIIISSILVISVFFLIDKYSDSKKVLKMATNRLYPQQKYKAKQEEPAEISLARSVKKLKQLHLVMKLSFPLFYIIIFVIFFSMVLQTTAQHELNLNFNQQVNIIAPYVSDSDIKRLKADWAQMQCKSDHEKIQDKLNRIARENNIAFPTNTTTFK